ncbi:tetratricopeptide repeat protein [Salinimicrobium sp. CAU 1759]
MKFHFLKVFLTLIFFLQFFGANAQIAQNTEEKENLIKEANTHLAKGEFDKAIINYEIILEENPERKALYENLVKAYAYLGMFETAKKRANELYGADPDNPMMIGGENCRLALINTLEKKNDEALEAIEEMEKVMDPEMIFPGAPTCSFMFQTKAGEYEEAWANIQKLLEVKDAGVWRNLFLLYGSYVTGKLGKSEKSQQLLSELNGNLDMMKKSGALEAVTKEGGAEVLKFMADYYMYLGQPEKAIASLQKHYEIGGRQYYWIKYVSPFLTPLEGNPHFVAILERMEEDIQEMRSNVKAQQF